MDITEILKEKKITPFQLMKMTGLPKTTVGDLTSGRASLQSARGHTLLAIAKALDMSVDELLALDEVKGKDNLPISKVYQEKGLPKILKTALLRYKWGLRMIRRGEKYTLLDCDYDELQSAIHVAETDHQISKESADYLREKYLGYEKGEYR
jgi:transcriptional regulator with XRE-family HTH domain